ncbi:flagellar basal body protein FliL [Saccharomonospora sp. NPDC046836]|uniref:flagellar basal body protein FliL n=1 Tax=Saccharomonospora sp. NPDC046836 TaxID=3156921 RepID=UPI0033F566D6
MTTPGGPGGQWPHQQGGFPPPSGGGYGDQQYQYPQQYPANGPQQQPYYPQQQGAFPVPPAGPPTRRRRGLVIGLVVALVVAAGAVGSWFAFRQSDSVAAGAATPTDAAMSFATSFGSGDVVGLLSALTPGEAALLTDPLVESTNELKRLGVVKPDADPRNLTGLEIQTANLTFDESQAEQVNDHLTITKLTGGTITVTADLSALPFADEYLDAIMADAGVTSPEEGRRTQTVDIGEVVRAGGEPLRIATVKVGDEWYPSLFYSVADYALADLGEQWPQQPIAANGAASPNEAVQQLVQAALDSDITRVIELLPPDEMGVLQDLGPLLVDAVGSATPTGAQLTKLETETSEVAGGTRATVVALEVEIPGEGTFSLTKDGDCYQLTVQDQSDQLCADQLSALVEEQAGADVPDAARQAISNIGTSVLQQGLGVVTTEVDGKHYVSPVRTMTELGMTFLRGMEPADFKTMLEGGF